MKILAIILFVLTSITYSQEVIDSENSRDLGYCSQGGVYLNNSVELAMCWGDNEKYTDWMMERQGFIRVYNYPNSPDAHFYQGGLVFGSNVQVVRALFRNHGLVELYTIFQNITDDPSFKSLQQTYEEFRDYFTDNSNGYKLIKEVPFNNVFQAPYNRCSGDCGNVEYKDRLVSIEIYLFIVGRAREGAMFYDSKSVAGISIEVPQWTMVGIRGIDKFRMKIPYFTLCFSEPKGTLARISEKKKKVNNYVE